MPTHPLLQIQNLQVARGKITILQDMGWTVETGQHWVVVGANGSGKTSLLQTITGYLMPTEGSLAVLGQVYGEYDWRELRKQIGIVSSSLAQKIEDGELPRALVAAGKTARYNVRGWIDPDASEAADRVLEQIDAVHLADRRWGVLSQGERQRVLVGRALMAEPKLLILDEPCAGLDPVARSRFLAFVRKLMQQNDTAIVLVTHHVEEIVPEITHALVLKSGRVLASGPKLTTLTSEHLSEAFGATVALEAEGESYRLRMDSADGEGLFE